MTFLPYDELTYYSFGLKAGVSSLAANGLSLGIKKTIGKIIQPINSYTRFPEYYSFDRAVRDYLSSAPFDHEIKILDVGSPKMFGLYLAFSIRAEVTLTDISELNVDEYRSMWRGMESEAKGKALFSLQDARSLQFEEGEFDLVYAMSVIEHVDGEGGDTAAMRELIRVLRPGGLLVVSVPFGTGYIEQKKIGLAGAVRRTNDNKAYFFQRIYDRAAFEQRILARVANLEETSFTTIWRKHGWAHRSFGALGGDVRGALGFLNPLLSVLGNESCKGINTSFDVEYESLHSARDVYGDLIMVGRKGPISAIHRGPELATSR
jgi:SAM-dependent methyltransferase